MKQQPWVGYLDPASPGEGWWQCPGQGGKKCQDKWGILSWPHFLLTLASHFPHPLLIPSSIPPHFLLTPLGAYYNGPKFKFEPVSGVGWFSYKIWTKNSKTHMVNLFKNHRPFQNYIFKIQIKIHLLTFSNTDQNIPIFFRILITYQWIKKLLSKLILDYGQCPKCTFTLIHFPVGAFPEFQNQFKNIFSNKVLAKHQNCHLWELKEELKRTEKN